MTANTTRYATVVGGRRDLLHEDNDCAVVALAAVTGRSYADAWNHLRAHGRRPRDGTEGGALVDALAAWGYRCHEIPAAGCTFEEAPTRYPAGRTLIMSMGHVAAIVGGALVDHGYANDQRVWFALRVERNAPTPKRRRVVPQVLTGGRRPKANRVRRVADPA